MRSAGKIIADKFIDGKRITFETLENFKVSEGKIAEFWGYRPDKEIEQLLQAI